MQNKMICWSPFLLHILLWQPSFEVLAAESFIAGGKDLFGGTDINPARKMYDGRKLQSPPKNLTITEEVWFDFSIQDYYAEGKHFKERVTIAIFGKLNPITCLNFVSLATGYRKGTTFMSYKGTEVQKIIRDFLIQLGDVKTKYSSGDSIYGHSFQDESFALSHNRAGWVGMANFGPDTNGSQFYILLGPAAWLDGKHVLFGKVVSGMNTLHKLEEEETGKGYVPLRTVLVEDSGIVGIKKHYVLTLEQLDTDEDIDTKRASV